MVWKIPGIKSSELLNQRPYKLSWTIRAVVSMHKFQVAPTVFPLLSFKLCIFQAWTSVRVVTEELIMLQSYLTEQCKSVWKGKHEFLKHIYTLFKIILVRKISLEDSSFKTVKKPSSRYRCFKELYSPSFTNSSQEEFVFSVFISFHLLWPQRICLHGKAKLSAFISDRIWESLKSWLNFM